MTRCGMVALVGRPNVGKSTLLNALVGEKLAIVSPKPQSTRQSTMGLVSRGDIQYLFMDAPGLFEPRSPLHEAMRAMARKTMADADVIAYLHPLLEAPAPPLTETAQLDAPLRAPVLAVYTKADLLSLHRRTAPPPGTLAVSALTGEGLDELLQQLRDFLPEGPFLYDAGDVSTQSLRFFAAEFVREAAFEALGEELPYSVLVEVDEFRERADPVYIRAVLYVERASQKGMVIGQGGRTIRSIGLAARPRIEGLLARRIYLDLWVKVLPKWRRRSASFERLGLVT